MVAAKVHQNGSRKSASRPSSRKTVQNIFLCIGAIAGVLPGCGRRAGLSFALPGLDSVLLESLLMQQIQRIRQNRAAECPQVQQQHMVDVVPVHQHRHLPPQIQILRRDTQIARPQPCNRRRIVLRYTPRIRAVPQPPPDSHSNPCVHTCDSPPAPRTPTTSKPPRHPRSPPASWH